MIHAENSDNEVMYLAEIGKTSDNMSDGIATAARFSTFKQRSISYTPTNERRANVKVNTAVSDNMSIGIKTATRIAPVIIRCTIFTYIRRNIPTGSF